MQNEFSQDWLCNLKCVLASMRGDCIRWTAREEQFNFNTNQMLKRAMKTLLIECFT